MENKRIYHKENIKDRMYKNATNFWGISNVENLDPLVKLLIESLASEIYRLSNEINNVEIRMLERIARLLTPDILMAARPSHMILHAQPVDTHVNVDKTTGFYYNDPSFNLKHKIQVSFYPVDTFSLVKGYVKYLVCGRSIYIIDPYQNKEIYTRSIVRSEELSKIIWIGLELDSSIKNVKNLSFYFDFLNTENKNEFLHLLPFTRWEFERNPLKISSGIYSSQNETDNKNKSFLIDYDLSSISDKSIKQYYDYQYITINDNLNTETSNPKVFPDEIKNLFSNDIISQIQESLYWLKVTFPPNFDENILENITVSINTFPVANKNLYTQHVKTDKITNIIPLSSNPGEHFLSVKSVSDSQNRIYEELPFHDSETHKYGTYSVKRGGIERFDIRNAKEYVSNLIDLLRDESAAFSMVGKGFLTGMITDLKNLISSMEHRLAEINANREVPSYLIVDSEETGETIYIDYWVSNCELTNNIKAGTLFKPSNGTFLNSNPVFSLTPSIGGKSIPKSNRTLDMYKYILSSRDRIYTTEDVINFCYSEFGDVISNVDVKKGVQVSHRPKEGLIRTIDVFVDLKPNFILFSTEQEVKNKLFNQLIKKSPEDFNYRIFVNK